MSGKHVKVGLELVAPGGARSVAVELKYISHLWSGEIGGEPFALENGRASDLRGYDVVKDMHRVERFLSARPEWSGLVIVLTNNARYWRPRTRGRETRANSFRLSEGTVRAGSRPGGTKTGATSRGLEAPLELPWVIPPDVDRLNAGRGSR